jgi:hypothetical protein
VLFKDEFGKFGVLALRCMHRGTSLEFGHIESGGFAVAIMAGRSTSTAKFWRCRGGAATARSKTACASRPISTEARRRLICLDGAGAGAAVAAL